MSEIGAVQEADLFLLLLLFATSSSHPAVLEGTDQLNMMDSGSWFAIWAMWRRISFFVIIPRRRLQGETEGGNGNRLTDTRGSASNLRLRRKHRVFVGLYRSGIFTFLYFFLLFSRVAVSLFGYEIRIGANKKTSPRGDKGQQEGE